MAFTDPLPYEVPVVPETTDKQTGKKVRSQFFSQEWTDWLFGIQRRADDSPEAIATLSLSSQSADIAATPVPMPSLTTGRYRVSYYTRVTRAASTSSELTITIGWTDGAVSLTSAGTLLDGNTTSTYEQRTLLLVVDANASITYTVDYTTVGGTTMTFMLQIVIEKLPD